MSSGSGALVLRELDQLRRAGVEATVDLALRLGHLLTIQSRLDGFSAFDELFGDDDLVPTFSWDSTVALRLSTWASFVYLDGSFRWVGKMKPLHDGSVDPDKVDLMELRLREARALAPD